MATSQTVIDRATALLKVRASGVTFSTDDSNKNTDAFTALKELISEWSEDAVIDIPAPATLGATLDIPEGTARALAFNLAVEIAPEFGKQPDPAVIAFARETRDRLEADMDLDIEVDLSGMPGQTKPYNINTDR